MIALVGHTGFVGSNIYASAGNEIGAVYNSKNIENAFDTHPDLLIYSGLRAEKYLANTAPFKDMRLIHQAEDNIVRIDPKRLVLVSTIDVFKTPKNVDETSKIDVGNLHPYGYNRYQLELWARERYPDALIIRLPGLFGKNIKKNFIYDFMNVIPSMLKKKKLDELSVRDPEIRRYYTDFGNGFCKVNAPDADRDKLKAKFRALNFSALNFTDSRSKYQFYNLSRLWNDLRIALTAGITVFHPATEPISAAELYEYLTGEKFINELDGVPFDYDYKTVYGHLYGSDNGYIETAADVKRQIRDFIETRD